MNEGTFYVLKHSGRCLLSYIRIGTLRGGMRLDIFLRAALVGMFAVGCPSLLPARGRAWDSRDCGNGVELRLSSLATTQGSLVQVEVRSASLLAKLKGDWAGQIVPFWFDDGHGSVYRALLGVDVERPSGQYELTLMGQLQNGQEVGCVARIVVKAGQFTIEKLQVGRKFVELSPEDAQRVEQEHGRLQELFARRTPDRLWQGIFRLPLDGVRTGGNFGRRRILNGQTRSPHTGIDFPAAAGTPVHAAQRGRVVLAGDLFFTGNTVVLDHGLGLYTLYAHLESVFVAVGDLVKVGATLGRVGATGRATGPHLHWGLTLNEARVNPLQIVSLRAE
jgi:murein DD-endopeptidase MepM/ murein hydrolase activator NlpD